MINEAQLRIIDNLKNIPGTSFYSESVQETFDELNNIKTLKELISKSTVIDRNRFNNILDYEMRKEVDKYNAFLKRVGRLENTFSFDVDYI